MLKVSNPKTLDDYRYRYYIYSTTDWYPCIPHYWVYVKESRTTNSSEVIGDVIINKLKGGLYGSCI